MWRTAILVPLSLIFHLGNVLSALPEPLAFFPLDGTFQTRESENRSFAGVASNAILAPGPDGNPNGSFQLSSGDDSSITFPNNESNNRLETNTSITMLAWVYITSSSGSLFQYLSTVSGFGVGLSIRDQTLLSGLAFATGGFQIHSFPFSLREEWVHLGMSYSSSTEQLTLFVNGEGNRIDLRTSLTIATQRDLVSNFGGRISQLRVYDVVLSEEQVQLVLQGCAELDDIIATVNCGRNITITIDQIPDAQHWIGREDQWRLNQYENDSCRPNFGLCSVSFGPFIGEHCTDVRSTSEDLIYTFRINTTVDLENLANLTLDHSYLFTCKYPRNGTTQTTFVTLSGIEDIANGVNALDFTLELFSDSNKEQAITSAIYPGSRIYVRVGLAHHFEEQLDLFLTECYTSTDQAGNLNRHNLIYNIGCSLDVVTEYSCSTQTNDTECFLTEIRRYAHQSQNDVVWLHCTVIACLSSSLCQTLCADCPTDRRRKRSTTELANQNEAIIYQLHSGPYRIVGMEEGPTHFSDITVEEREKLNTSAQVVVILMVSSVVAVAIMCVTVIVVLRKRALILTSSQSSVSGKAFENQGCETTDTNNKI